MACVYIIYTAAYLEFLAMFGAALWKSSDNQQQHLLPGQRWIIGNAMRVWLSTSSQRRILDLGNKVYQDFGKFNSLRNTRSTISLSLCLLFTLLKQHLDMCTYKVETQPRRRWLATFDITIHNRQEDRRYLLSYLPMFSSISSRILFLVWYDHYLTEITNQLLQIEH